MGMKSAPPPPDPKLTAGAQTANNIQTAITQQHLNNQNQITPDGSITYNQSGTNKVVDPNTGNVFHVPKFTMRQTLSESGKKVKQQTDAADLNLATLAKDQSGRLGKLLGKPVDLSNDAVEGRLMELGRKRLDPALERRRETLRTNLSQQGIKEGSEAFDRAMMRNGESENDAYNNLLLSGRGQSVQETLTSRNQPINEITALLSGSQVSQPNFMATNPSQVANVDRAGLEMAAHNSRVQGVNAHNAGRQSLLGGLFGLASGGLAGGYF